MLMILTPKALRNIARGWRLCAYPGRSVPTPRVAAEKTRQPWAMSHNAFGVALVAKVNAYGALPLAHVLPPRWGCWQFAVDLDAPSPDRGGHRQAWGSPASRLVAAPGAVEDDPL
jgi:hypothetical protein